MSRSKLALYASWFIALLAVVGSLYFSEVLHLPPCLLCWYQRIFMYPLAIIIGMGLIRNDRNMPYYALPLSLIGLGIATYHVLLYYGFISENLLQCSLSGVSCTVKQIEWLGFVSIPLLSFIAFVFITFSTAFALAEVTKGRAKS
jgi:disulfide bond formation protein DsbB